MSIPNWCINIERWYMMPKKESSRLYLSDKSQFMVYLNEIKDFIVGIPLKQIIIIIKSNKIGSDRTTYCFSFCITQFLLSKKKQSNVENINADKSVVI